MRSGCSRVSLGPKREARGARGKQLLTAEQVAEFLRQNPGFFENHVDILMDLQIPHPHGGRAVSIGEGQLVAVRGKAKILEDKLRERVQFGEERESVVVTVHRLSWRLMAASRIA